MESDLLNEYYLLIRGCTKSREVICECWKNSVCTSLISSLHQKLKKIVILSWMNLSLLLVYYQIQANSISNKNIWTNTIISHIFTLQIILHFMPKLFTIDLDTFDALMQFPIRYLCRQERKKSIRLHRTLYWTYLNLIKINLMNVSHLNALKTYKFQFKQRRSTKIGKEEQIYYLYSFVIAVIKCIPHRIGSSLLAAFLKWNVNSWTNAINRYTYCIFRKFSKWKT